MGIHVYVDKPIAYTADESRRVVEAAERAGRILMVGFNRRFAPMYRALRAATGPRVMLMQKNRIALPDYARRVVFDDFVHVVDTLRFLAAGEVDDVRVTGHHRDGRLHHVMLHLRGADFSAIGLMHRDSGANEETLEMIAPGDTWTVRGLSTTVHRSAGEERTHRSGDWESALHRRGFPQIVDHFLVCVREGREPEPAARDSLATHELCERIVAELEQGGAAAWS